MNYGHSLGHIIGLFGWLSIAIGTTCLVVAMPPTCVIVYLNDTSGALNLVILLGGLLALACGIVLVRVGERTVARRRERSCPTCGYDLHNLRDRRCPECGSEY